jgi:hypothetical protein
MSEQRFTLTLPAPVYQELKQEADARGISVAEVARQVLKFGLVALKLDGDPNVDLYVKEKTAQADSEGGTKIIETRLKFVF